MSRRVLTKSTIDEALAAGETQIVVGERDIVTALAKEYAADRGIVLAEAAVAPAAAPVASAPDPVAPRREDLASVRQAVIAALGYEPEALDRVIAKLQRES